MHGKSGFRNFANPVRPFSTRPGSWLSSCPLVQTVDRSYTRKPQTFVVSLDRLVRTQAAAQPTNGPIDCSSDQSMTPFAAPE